MNQFYPLPTTGVTLPSGNNYIVNEKAYSYWDNAVVKIDQQLAAHDEASIKYLFRHEHTTKPFSGSDTGQWGSVLHNLQTIVAFNETHIFTPNLINDFRSGLTRNVNNEHPFDMGIPWGALLGINGGTTNPALEDFPYFNVNGYETLGDSTQQPIQYTSNNYDTNDSLTWSHGKHTVKFGGDMLKVQYFQPTNSEFSGSIGFSGRATQGKPATTSTAQNGFLEFLSGFVSTVDLRLGNTVNHLFDTSCCARSQYRTTYKARYLGTDPQSRCARATSCRVASVMRKMGSSPITSHRCRRSCWPLPKHRLWTLPSRRCRGQRPTLCMRARSVIRKRWSIRTRTGLLLASDSLCGRRSTTNWSFAGATASSIRDRA